MPFGVRSVWVYFFGGDPEWACERLVLERGVGVCLVTATGPVAGVFRGLGGRQGDVGWLKRWTCQSRNCSSSPIDLIVAANNTPEAEWVQAARLHRLYKRLP